MGSSAHLDLCYEEDSHAEVDLNVVRTGGGSYVEVQGTAEGRPFSRDGFGLLLDLADQGCRELTELQRRVLALPDDRTV